MDITDSVRCMMQEAGSSMAHVSTTISLVRKIPLTSFRRLPPSLKVTDEVSVLHTSGKG